MIQKCKRNKDKSVKDRAERSLNSPSVAVEVTFYQILCLSMLLVCLGGLLGAPSLSLAVFCLAFVGIWEKTFSNSVTSFFDQDSWFINEGMQLAACWRTDKIASERSVSEERKQSMKTLAQTHFWHAVSNTPRYSQAEVLTGTHACVQSHTSRVQKKKKKTNTSFWRARHIHRSNHTHQIICLLFQSVSLSGSSCLCADNAMLCTQEGG